MSFVSWLIANWSLLLNAVVGLLSALVAVCLIIPGSQPEKALQAVLDFLKKFSAK